MNLQNCILINFERRHVRTAGRTDGMTDGHTDRPKAICPFNFSNVGGIKKRKLGPAPSYVVVVRPHAQTQIHLRRANQT